MKGPVILGHSRSLVRQVQRLEDRIQRRPDRLRLIVVGIKRKTAARMASPGTLLAATGIGIAIEQTSHHRRWTAANILNAGYAVVTLLLSFPSPALPVSSREYKKRITS